MHLLRNAGVDPSAEPGPPPKIEGVVTAVNPQGLVEISIGSDDGIREGHKLDVYRANPPTYLGRIEVIKTTPDRAVGKILPELQKGAIRKGDRVATGLGEKKP
jgi:hypothetical protein